MNATSDRSHPLASRIYAELQRLARRRMQRQPADHTLRPTELVHEAYLKIAAHSSCDDDDQFLRLAAQAMRSVLVDHARAKGRQKRARPKADRVPVEDLVASFETRAVDLLALDEALDQLATFDPLMAQAVELRFFAGVDVGKTAALLGLPRRSFERRWLATRSWLYQRLA